MAATKEVVKEILSSIPAPAPARPPRTVKAQKTAAKVQLMKLKMGSKVGDSGLPQEERVYFLVCPPRELARAAVGAWVSRAWSMGRWGWAGIERLKQFSWKKALEKSSELLAFQ